MNAAAGIVEVRVPDMGNFKDVAIIDVLVKPGEKIEPEASLVTLETEKATMDVPSTVGGIVDKVHVSKGGTVSPGDLIVTVRSEGSGDSGPADAAAKGDAGAGAGKTSAGGAAGPGGGGGSGSSVKAADTASAASPASTGSKKSSQPEPAPAPKQAAPKAAEKSEASPQAKDAPAAQESAASPAIAGGDGLPPFNEPVSHAKTTSLPPS